MTVTLPDHQAIVPAVPQQPASPAPPSPSVCTANTHGLSEQLWQRLVDTGRSNYDLVADLPLPGVVKAMRSVHMTSPLDRIEEAKREIAVLAAGVEHGVPLVPHSHRMLFAILPAVFTASPDLWALRRRLGRKDLLTYPRLEFQPAKAAITKSLLDACFSPMTTTTT